MMRLAEWLAGCFCLKERRLKFYCALISFYFFFAANVVQYLQIRYSYLFCLEIVGLKKDHEGQNLIGEGLWIVLSIYKRKLFPN